MTRGCISVSLKSPGRRQKSYIMVSSLYHTLPCMESKDKGLAMACIRSINLDVFWRRARSMAGRAAALISLADTRKQLSAIAPWSVCWHASVPTFYGREYATIGSPIRSIALKIWRIFYANGSKGLCHCWMMQLETNGFWEGHTFACALFCLWEALERRLLASDFDFMIEHHGKGQPQVVIPLLGKFMGDNHSSQHLIPCVAVTVFKRRYACNGFKLFTGVAAAGQVQCSSTTKESNWPPA